MINFPFGTNGKLIILGVPILKHITVLTFFMIKFLFDGQGAVRQVILYIGRSCLCLRL